MLRTRTVIGFSAYFDPDEVDAAFAELDARYIAGEAAPHVEVFRAMIGGVEAYNLRTRDHPRVSPDLVVDHLRLPIVPVDGLASYRTSAGSHYENVPTDDFNVSMPTLLELVPDLTMRIPIVHRLDTRGAVFGHVMEGTNQDGGHVSWSLIVVLDRNGRADAFPEDQLDTALARFEESGTPT